MNRFAVFGAGVRFLQWAESGKKGPRKAPFVLKDSKKARKVHRRVWK